MKTIRLSGNSSAHKEIIALFDALEAAREKLRMMEETNAWREYPQEYNFALEEYRRAQAAHAAAVRNLRA